MTRTEQIVLASQSPRRRQLLGQIGVSFFPCSADIDETMRPGEAAAEFAERMAHEKAAAIGPVDGLPVLGADTVVVLGERVLGKPRSLEEAKTMLAALSGRQHKVITAVAVITSDGKVLQTSNTTTVEFKPLSSDEINVYCATGDSMDKAGAYGVQGLAAMFICHLDGSHSGVMGLPLFETAQLLRDAGVKIPAE
jgi:septum formation protein